MKLLFLTSGSHTPSTRFRALPFVSALRAAGHTCVIAHSFPEKYDYFPWLGFRPSQWLKRGVRYGHLWRARFGRFDAVILERELFHNPTWDLERRFRRVAKTLVLDLDDAVFLNFPEKLPHIVRMCDLVVVGNRWLQDWVAPFEIPTEIIPTCIDTDEYQPAACREGEGTSPVVIGWMGTSGNVAYLRVVAAALRSLAARHPFVLQVIANGRGDLDRLDLAGVKVQFRDWNPASEATDIHAFDIGLMPLTDDDWSRYKCGLKLLQYMAVGIPGVASPVGVNTEIITEGVNGLLAATSAEWESSLGQLLADSILRRQMGAAARQTVENRYSVAANLPRWIEAVQRAIASADHSRHEGGRPRSMSNESKR